MSAAAPAVAAGTYVTHETATALVRMVMGPGREESENHL